MCYSNFHFSMRDDREDAMKNVPKELVFYEPNRVSRLDTWKNQVKYAFVLSPHGNGLDCHRTWEALCLGCIPIVKTSPIDAVFDELPVLIVKQWSDITKELLDNYIKNFDKSKFNYDRITLAYWIALIRSKKTTAGGGRVRIYSKKHLKKKHKKSRRTRNRRYSILNGGNTDITTTSLKRAFVCVLNSMGGFFAVYFTLLRVYLYAKKLNVPFFIEHNNWQYTYKDGWHDYFKSLNVLNKEEHFDVIERFENGATNAIMDAFTMGDFIEAIKETFILEDSIQASIDSYIKEIGSDYTSLYVRRGDKVLEMQLISLDTILAQINIKDDGRVIFVQTDDFNIVKDMRSKFPSNRIITLTKEDVTGSRNLDLLDWTPEERKEHTEELLKSCVITARANTGWSYYMSNVGHFIKLLGFNNINIYVDDIHTSKEDINNIYRLETKYNDYIAAVKNISDAAKK